MKTATFHAILQNLLKPRSRVTQAELVVFSRQFSTLISAGVPITQGLAILETQSETPALRSLLGSIRADIEGGKSISDALKAHSETFPDLYTAMVRAGEMGGILDAILERLTAYLESSEALRVKVKSAMMYPAIVLAICACVTIFLIVVVIPTFKSVFISFGAELPLPTRLLLGVSEFIKHYFIVVMAIPIAGWYGFQRFYKTKKGRKMVDTQILRAPVVGTILRKVAIAKFTRTLGTLIKSGVPILQSLETAASTAGNAAVAEAILQTREAVREGGHLDGPLKKSGLFPNMVTSMIAVGEETGNLDTMLNKIADFYDQEVDGAVKGLTSLIEPVVIVLMGLVIGSIVVAMFLPMFNLGEIASNLDSTKAPSGLH